MTEFNVIAELPDTDHDAVADELLDALSDHSPVIARSLTGRTEVILTINDAADVHGAITRAHELLAGRQIVALRALPTEDFDRATDMQVLPPLLSVTEAADRLGVTRTRVQALIDEGKLPARKVGSTWVILGASVAELSASAA